MTATLRVWATSPAATWAARAVAVATGVAAALLAPWGLA